MGRNLRVAFRDWIQAAVGGKVPVEETADLGAAIVGRIVRVSLVGLAVALMPAAMFFWQNWEIRKQSALFAEQIERQTVQHAQSMQAQARQLDQQQTDALIVRRAQLLATIYDCAEEQPKEGDKRFSPKICMPKAHPRAREEALKAYITLERRQGKTPVLTDAYFRSARLAEVDLAKVNFSRTDFAFANLAEADMSNAKLQDTNFSNADLSKAYLAYSDVTGANFELASLYSTNFIRAQIARLEEMKSAHVLSTHRDGGSPHQEVLLSLVTLRLKGANVSHARFVNVEYYSLIDSLIGSPELSIGSLPDEELQAQFNQAIGDEATVLPAGIQRPMIWSAKGLSHYRVKDSADLPVQRRK